MGSGGVKVSANGFHRISGMGSLTHLLGVQLVDGACWCQPMLQYSVVSELQTVCFRNRL